MMRHDESLLWQYAAKELDADSQKVMQHHLTECPECQEGLSDVHTARGAIEAARGLLLQPDYEVVDAQISALIARKTAALGSRGWLYGLGGALVTAGLAIAVVGTWKQPVVEPVVAPVEVVSTANVEKAVSLSRVGAAQEPLSEGATLQSGDVLKTMGKGEALVRLPDGSRLKLAADSQLSLTRLADDEIALTLERGRVVVGASHAARKSFVVHSGGLLVRVVGTQFAVANTPQGIEVAVADGKVVVEPPDALPLYVNAGQRTRFDTQRWRMKRDALPASVKNEMLLVQADLPPPPPMPEPVPSVGGAVAVAEPVAPPSDEAGNAIAAAVTMQAASEHEVVEPELPLPPLPSVATRDEPKQAPQRGGLLPRLTPAQSRARVAEAKAMAASSAATPEIPAAPKAATPSAGGSHAPLAAMAADVANDLKRPEMADDFVPESYPVAAAKKADPAPAPRIEVVGETGNHVPSLAGPGVAGPPIESLVRQDAQWEQMPPKKTAPAPAAAAKLGDESIPEDAEAIFLQRAERSLMNGGCERYLLGLEEVATDVKRGDRSERARIIRARCFDATMKPTQASAEYRKYLQQHPRGRYVEEARQILNDE